MTHRALQVVDAIKASLLASSTLEASVYRNRSTPLSWEDAELPAVAVNLAEDTPVDEDGAGNIAFLDSLVTVSVMAVTSATTEDELVEELSRLRAEVHMAVMADRTQGLAFVQATRYGGASAPEIDTAGSRYAGRQESRWVVLYRMSVTDPN